MNALSVPWISVCHIDEIPLTGARIVPSAEGDIGVFRCADGRVFAIGNRCPHKQGPLSEGIVHGQFVACPLHNWVIDLETGQATGADSGCVPVIPLKIEDGRVHLRFAAIARPSPRDI